MGGVEIILVDEKKVPDSNEIVATSEHIYLCRNTDNPILSIQDLGTLWDDKWDKKTLIDVEGKNVGSTNKLNDYLFFSKGDQGLCRLKGITDLIEKEMEELTKEYCQVFNIGTDGRFLYLDSDTPKKEMTILINSELEVIKTFDSSISPIFSGTEFFYRCSKDLNRNTYEKFRDGILLEDFNLDICATRNELHKSCEGGGDEKKLAEIIREKEYPIHSFTDGSELYTLTSFGDIWHISNKPQLVYSASYAANDEADATNGKYGVLFEGKKALAFAKGRLVGEYDSPINSEDIIDMNAHDKFVYVLLHKKLQRYRILD